MRKLFGNTWVGWLNKIVIQWFFVRLAYNDEGGWFILGIVVPMTGWWNNYWYVKKLELKKIYQSKK
jgi:hypothetical protein